MNDVLLLARAMFTCRGRTPREVERWCRDMGLSKAHAVGFVARHKGKLGLRAQRRE
jgi:hypothetical protein